MIVANILLMLTLMISQQTTPEVDEEGYSIRPDEHATNNGDKNSWYSSDSDSDSGQLTSVLYVWLQANLLHFSAFIFFVSLFWNL